MTKEEFYAKLKRRFIELLRENEIENETITLNCKALSPEEAIGNTERRDFPIITGKDVMIQAQFRNSFGQAFTEAPCTFEGSLNNILELDIVNDSHARSLFIAAINAVMCYLGKCSGTVHCRTKGPERCSRDMYSYLRENYPDIERIALIGYQPALVEMLSKSEYEVRVLDLDPSNIGNERYGIMVEDGNTAYSDIIHNFAQLILCTGSTVCNGTIVNYLGLNNDVVFFGTSISGCAELMGLKRVCFAERYK